VLAHWLAYVIWLQTRELQAAALLQKVIFIFILVLFSALFLSKVFKRFIMSFGGNFQIESA